MLPIVALGLCGCGPSDIPGPRREGPLARSATAEPLARVEPSLVAERSLAPLPAASIPLGGEWRFSVDSDQVGEDEGWADPGFDDSAWMKVTVPHTWGVMEEHADYEGIAWYRRSLALPEAHDAHLRLRFDAVFYLARVWLNGEYLGEHEGGYTPFEFDVTAASKPGTENIVAVRVDNRRDMNRIPATLRRDWSYDWWNWGGIVRDVSLTATGRTFIAGQRVIAVPHLTGRDQADSATVTATVTVHNRSDRPVEGMVAGDVLDDAEGLSVIETQPTAPFNLGPGESTAIELAVEVTEPRLWHFDHPLLYRWSTSLQAAEGASLHRDEVTFGIRSVTLADARFTLNGEPMRLVGLTRHADSPRHGLAETVTVMARDYDDLKTLNMVFSRPVHYPQHEFILDYCDRQGILLIPEAPAWQLTAEQMASEPMRELEKQQLREMIDAAFNHPSVWAWSVGNEYDSKSVAGHEFTRDMIEYVKSLDPTRPVGFASNRLDQQPALDATRFADFVMMNQYFGTWVGPKTGLSQALDDIHAAWPDKAVVISEYGFEPHWNARWGPPSSSLDPAEHYFIPEDVPADSEEADIQRQLVIREQMEVFRSKPFVAAAIFWTYQDYRTRSDFVMGVVDSERNKRGSWYLLREEHTPVSIQSVTFGPESGGSPSSAVQSAEVNLRSRGPGDMPSYTLWGYGLHWSVTSPSGEETFAAGEVVLPTLEPGTEWTGVIEWTEPEAEYVLTLGIIRPTGFSVLERTYDATGTMLGRE